LRQVISETKLRNGQLVVPCSSSQAVDKSRIKTKDVYEGIYKASTRRKLHASMGANNVVQTLWATFHDANGLKL